MENEQPVYNTQNQNTAPGLPNTFLEQPNLVGSKLSGPVEILRHAWSIYKSRFWVLIGIYLAPSFVVIIYIALIAAGVLAGVQLTKLGTGVATGALIAGIILGFLFYLAIIYIGIWAQAALLFAIKGAEARIGLVESFKQASHKVVSFFGASMLVTLAISGVALLFILPGYMFLFGPVFFWLLPIASSIWVAYLVMGIIAFILAIPAIVIAVRYSLTTFVVIGDDTNAMPAIKRSSDYVKGYWWPVLWRFFFIGVIAIVLWVVLSLFTTFLGNFFQETISGLMGIVISSVISLGLAILLPPLYVAYGYKVYDDLKSIKGESQIPAVKAGGLGMVLAILGIVIVIIVLVGALFVLPALNSARAKSRDAKRIADVRQFAAGLELYFVKYNSYPKNFSQLSSTMTIPVAPEPTDGSCAKTQNSYQYQLIETARYQLTFCLGSATGGYSAGMHTLTEYGIDEKSGDNFDWNDFNTIFPSDDQKSDSTTTVTNYVKFTFSDINLPLATVGQYYDGSIDFSPCYSYSGYTTEQAIPPGLVRGGPATLSAVTGDPNDTTDVCRIFIVGTPTQAGQFTFQITLDAYGSNSKTQSFDLQVKSN